MTPKLKRVLLVDDSEADNFLHSRQLRKLEVAEDILIQPNGKAALDYLTGADTGGDPPHVDLIFLDINMPVMNGWEFLEAYRNLPPRLKTAKVISMLTSISHGSEMDRAAAFPEVSGYMEKPLTRQKLLDILQQHFPQ